VVSQNHSRQILDGMQNEQHWNSINVKADSFFVTGSLQHSVCYAALCASSHFFSHIESILGDVHLYAPVRFLHRNLSSAQCYEKMSTKKGRRMYNNRNALFLYLHTNTRIHICIHIYKVHIIDGTNRFSKQGIFVAIVCFIYTYKTIALYI